MKILIMESLIQAYQFKQIKYEHKTNLEQQKELELEKKL